VQNLFHVELKCRNTRSASCTPTANAIGRYSGTVHCNVTSFVIHDLLDVVIFNIITIREFFLSIFLPNCHVSCGPNLVRLI